MALRYIMNSKLTQDFSALGAAAFALCLSLTATGANAEVVSLPAFNIDVDQTSVSGLSSGAYMAVQMHVAFSKTFRGAGIIAGGPYFCAQDDQDTALSVCACFALACQNGQAAQRVSDLVQVTNQNASQGAIDPTGDLANDRVWLFSGSLDSVVPPPVMNALDLYYKNYISAADISFKKNLPAEHAMPTESFGNACGFRGDPFINDCNFDGAGELLNWIYGGLAARNSGALLGEFVEFDQSEFLPNAEKHGLWPSGWAYVPAACAQGDQCRLHVAFHGCKQYPGASFASGPQGKMGDTFVKNAGYNQWADTNKIIVLYPQANALNIGTRLPRTNPNGCWDWWGYDDANYAKKTGRQMAAVKLMVDRVAGLTAPPPGGFCGTTSNADHASAGRAHTETSWWFWTSYYATGSDEYLGWRGSATTTLKETTAGHFRQVAVCP